MKSSPKYLMIITALLMVACSIGNSPKKSAQKFLDAFNERDFQEARKYATPETNKLIDLMENLTKMSNSKDTTEHKKVEVLTETIDGDKATVTFKEEGGSEEQTLDMKKVDGKWLVHITKEDVAAKNNGMLSTTPEEDGLMMESDSTEAAADSLTE